MSSQESPLVSIVTPVFNEVKYIEKCIQSVLTQSYPHIEHIIVDGGSSDGTVEILSSYRNKYPDKIRFISEPDKGAGDAWNKGLKMAKGDIFGILGADDVYVPGAIKEVVNFFIFHPEAFFVHGNCENIDENGNLICLHRIEKFNLQDFINTARHISTPSAFYRREVMEKIGWLDSSGDDFDVMIRITRDFKVHTIDKILSQLTVRENSVYNSPKDFRSQLKIRKQTYEISRKYGGSIFTRIALRYYSIFVFDRLNLEKLYPVAENMFVKVLRLLRKIKKGI